MNITSTVSMGAAEAPEGKSITKMNKHYDYRGNQALKKVQLIQALAGRLEDLQDGRQVGQNF